MSQDSAKLRPKDPLVAIRGFEDLLPATAARHAHVENIARAVFLRYGYREIRTPILEPTELFARSAGEASDVVVHKQMYTFQDPGQRSNTLRPEGTAGVVRALVEHNVLHQTPLQKLWYIGPMFRYERPQKGRLRQFHQIGVEAFGTTSPEQDAEIIALCRDLLRDLGFQQLTVKINSLGDRDDRLQYNAQLRERILETTQNAAHQNPEPPAWVHDWQRLAQLNPMRVFDTKDPLAHPYLKELPRISTCLGPAASQHHQRVCNALDALEISYEQDPDLVRGLDYYNRTVFEIVQGNIGAQSAILGGGRYDGLVEELGGPAVPGVGMAIGLERLLLSMDAAQLLPAETQLLPPPDDFVVCFDEEALPTAFLLAQQGRQVGRRVHFEPIPRKPKAALREAARSQAKRALILGTNELATATVQIKNLVTGEQKALPLYQAFESALE